MSFLTHEYIDHDNVAIDFAKGDSIIFTNHHHDKIFESASLIKLPIMIYIYENTTQEDRKALVQINHKVGGSGVLKDMNIDQLSIQDLIYLMIVVSDNTATNTLIDHYGLQHINLFIQDILQCEHTQLNRYMMDVEAINEGKQNTTSSQDMIDILRFIAQHQHHQEMMSIMNDQHLNDKVSIYRSFHEDTLNFHSKTGEYDNVVNDVGMIQHEENLYYYCFLSNTNKPKKAIDFSHQFGSYVVQSILDI